MWRKGSGGGLGRPRSGSLDVRAVLSLFLKFAICSFSYVWNHRAFGRVPLKSVIVIKDRSSECRPPTSRIHLPFPHKAGLHPPQLVSGINGIGQEMT